MALNLGPVAFEAISVLQNNADWKLFVDALEEQMSTLMHRAIEGPVADRADATGYARAVRDLVAHIQQITKPLPGGRAPKPVVAKDRREAAHV